MTQDPQVLPLCHVFLYFGSVGKEKADILLLLTLYNLLVLFGFSDT